MSVHVDLNEGRTVELGCTKCREDVEFWYVMAEPVRYLDVALECPECNTQTQRWRS